MEGLGLTPSGFNCNNNHVRYYCLDLIFKHSLIWFYFRLAGCNASPFAPICFELCVPVHTVCDFVVTIFFTLSLCIVEAVMFAFIFIGKHLGGTSNYFILYKFDYANYTEWQSSSGVFIRIPINFSSSMPFTSVLWVGVMADFDQFNSNYC